MATTADLVADYTARFSARHLDEHSIGSGLGVWLLLALLAPATEGEERRRLEAALGTDAEDAGRRATELLADPHPAVLAAVALWDRPEAMTSAFDQWQASLSALVERGPMPSQAEADAWADRHTLGMIPTFPVQIDSRTLIVLASALASDVTWTWPFAATPAEDLGGPFGASVDTALRAPDEHLQQIVDTDAAGLVAVHAAESASGLRVISVIGAPDVSPAVVHSAAHQVTALLGGVPGSARTVDLFDLPLGEGHAWTLTEDEIIGSGGKDRVQSVTSVLPAWSARSQHDLAGTSGRRQVERSFLAFTHGGSNRFDARQSAFAEYTRRGFRAAAVTGVATAMSICVEREVRRRRAEVRFDRPYAVVAVALDQRADPDRPYLTAPLGLAHWAGVPVFSAWVAEAREVPDDEDVPAHGD